ncbi:cysteine desulfurase family protein [Alphaproteobacteria bacterium endosymbiont of Tiliacea citrago]|uniref:cysteine desulfurase family protein n=1 Tax=Alphaproteobacteria bacterium endosymbiont of Tiliacea citrago TaxID=3077944 RepID=UPI00313BA069
MIKYFDYAATTPCHEDVIKEMNKYWNENFGNPDSRSHEYGWKAEEAVENAKKIIATALKVEASEIYFTSGATEANNLAIKGFVNGISYNNKKIACLVTEHKCLIETLRDLNKTQQIPIDFIPVNSDGLINWEYFLNNIKEYSLVSIGYVNNETGVKQDISQIAKICRENNVKIHTDCAQAFGKIDINAREVDLLSISGHKIYGPKGIGVLFISKKPRVRIKAMMSGGGQQNNIRSGTIPTPLCVGMAKATEICLSKMNKNTSKFNDFQSFLIENLTKNDAFISINGSLEHKIPHILNLNIPYIEGESLIMRLKNFALSSGSACTSKSLEPSYVISAMHPEERELAHSSLRISFGIYTTFDDVKELLTALQKHIKELRELSPLWHMKKKNIDLQSIKWKK